MRFLFPAALLVSAAALAQPAAAPVVPGQPQTPLADISCPDSDRYLAEVGKWRGQPLKPQKLSELPPAESFAAMLRRDERGCMVPVKYRDVRP